MGNVFFNISNKVLADLDISDLLFMGRCIDLDVSDLLFMGRCNIYCLKEYHAPVKLISAHLMLYFNSQDFPTGLCVFINITHQ